jgi:hypothetical protein
MEKFNYVPIKLLYNEEELKITPEFENSSYFQYSLQIMRENTIAPLAQGLNRDKLLNVWKDIQPSNGQYVFEIAVNLPFFLPAHQKKDEYIISVHKQKYIISNRHCEVIFENKPNEFYLTHYLLRDNVAETFKNSINQIIMTKTLVITEFTVKASSASEAIEQNYNIWIETINNDVQAILTALRYNLDKGYYLLPECQNIEVSCPIYVVCTGNKQGRALRVTSKMDVCSLKSHGNVKCDISVLENYCDNVTKYEMPKIILSKANLFLRSGDYSLACILACMACESILFYEINNNLRKLGLSNSKEKDALSDLTFSQMLNLISYFIVDMKNDTNKEIIGKINSMRKIRNNLIHKGKWVDDTSKQIVEEGMKSVVIIKEIISQSK